MADSITLTVKDQTEINPAQARIKDILLKTLPGGPVAITLGRPEEKRTVPQNSKIHAVFADIQSQGVIKMPGRRTVLSNFTVDEVKALSVVWFANERELEGRPLKNRPAQSFALLLGSGSR